MRKKATKKTPHHTPRVLHDAGKTLPDPNKTKLEGELSGSILGGASHEEHPSKGAKTPSKKTANEKTETAKKPPAKPKAKTPKKKA